MSQSNEFVKAAIMGTDKYMPQLQLESVVFPKAATNQNESTFLRQANIVFLMEEAGQELVQKELEIPACAEESKEVISTQKTDLLKKILASNNESLFEFFIWHCNQQNWVIDASLVPTILHKARKQVKTAAPLLSVCGETGKWLISLNKDWQVFENAQLEDEDWELGSIQSRKQYLTELRKENPIEVISIFERMFSKESAANRIELIEVFTDQPSKMEEPFLVSLLKDKSLKVKDAVTKLLAQIPGSEINQMLVNALSQIASVKEERHMLVSKKKVLNINQSVVLDDAVFALGIDKICSIKGVPDADYWFFQMLLLIPPSQVAVVMQTTDRELIDLILKLKHFKRLSFYITESVDKFEHTPWAEVLLKEMEEAPILLLKYLSEKDRLPYYQKFSKTHPMALMDLLMTSEYKPISKEMAIDILNYLQENRYSAHSDFIQKFALYLPMSILPKLQGYANNQALGTVKEYFQKQMAEMIQILETKQLILN